MRKWFLFILLSSLWAAGCATQTRIDIAPLAIPGTNTPKEKVLVLPFAAYEGLDLRSWEQLNLGFYEAFKGHFLEISFFTVPFEDVLEELYRRGKLKIRQPNRVKISPSLLETYQQDWSPIMKEEIKGLIMAEVKRQSKGNLEPKVQLSFEEADIFSLAQKFKARYVLRGRIVEFDLRDEDTLNPFKIGFLTAQNRFLSRLFYGAPQEQKIGTVHEVSVGGVLAGILGSNAKDPFHPPHKETYRIGHPLFGETYTREVGGDDNYDFLNALSWGAAGAFISYLAAHGGNSPEAVINISVYLYDVKENRLVWENRVRLRVSPQSVWAPRKPVDLLLVAIEEAARLLATQMQKDLGFVSLAANEYQK